MYCGGVFASSCAVAALPSPLLYICWAMAASEANSTLDTAMGLFKDLNSWITALNSDRGGEPEESAEIQGSNATDVR